MRTSSTRRQLKKGVALSIALGLSCSGLVMAAPAASAAPAAPLPTVMAAPVDALPGGLEPIDPQDVADMNELSWNDYVAIPDTDYANPAVLPTIKKWRAALVLVDYPDLDFIISQPQGSTKWGNPTAVANNIPRADVPQFYADMMNKPSAMNNFHTINEYWMEDTGGRYGVDMFAYGPYRMPSKSYQYYYQSYGNSGGTQTDCPATFPCNKNIRTDALAAWTAATGLRTADFDNVFYIGAGVGQSSAWLEFGSMMFKTKEEIPDLFGPPQEWKDAIIALGQTPVNWAPTRYVSWTSWAAAASMWANASGNTSIESEGDGPGTFAHEFSHNLAIGDNYGNPYAIPSLRDQSGAWDMMSRGSFNGPGGAHKRWDVPSTLGDIMGSQHMLRDKIFLNTVAPAQVVNVTRAGLATSGVLVTNVSSRSAQKAGTKLGVNVQLEGTTATGGGDQSTCATQGNTGDRQWLCDSNSATGARGNYQNYTMEVVDQMGSDSFTADSGVLLAKTKTSGSPNKWTIDADPTDIDTIDYYEADGTPVKFGRGDHRQLNDALFKAGSDSDSQFEYIDVDNKLHFYILNTQRDAKGILSYDLAVRNTTASGAQTRGVTLGTSTVAGKTPGQVVSCTIPLRNTGGTAEDAMYSSDVYRLTASAVGDGWTTWLPQQIAAAPAGGSTDVVVYGIRAAGAVDAATLSLTATSESDTTKTATRTCAVTTSSTATPGSGVQVITAAVTGNPLTLSVPSTQPVVLNPVELTGMDQVTSGSMNNMQVVDSRGTAAGWDLTGQASDFVAGAGTILADNLGWRPSAMVYTGTLPTPVAQASSVMAGAVAVPGNGLATGKRLCASPAGQSAGSFTCGGGLDLGIPGSARFGTYSGLLTFTLI